MSMSSRRTRARSALLALALALAGPSVARADAAREGAPPVEPAAATAEELALRKRALEYWEARVAGSERVFAFYAPPDKGGPRGPGEVSERGNLRFTRFEIEGIELRGDEGAVLVRVEAELPPQLRRRPPPAGGGAPRLRELWDRIDGNWYKRPTPRGFGRKAATKRSEP
jgi:hypothetical protein